MADNNLINPDNFGREIDLNLDSNNESNQPTPQTTPPVSDQQEPPEETGSEGWNANPLSKMKFDDLVNISKEYGRQNAKNAQTQRRFAADMGLTSDLENLNFEPLIGYDRGLRRGMDQEDVRAANQSDIVALANGIHNTFTSLITDSIYFTGAMVEAWELARTGKMDFDNSIMKFAEGIDKAISADVYVRKSGREGFDISNREWWALHLPTIVTGLSIAVPVVGAGKILGALGRVARFGKLAKVARITQQTRRIGKGLKAAKLAGEAAQGVAARHIEMVAEAKATYDEIYNLGLERGLDEEQAALKAGEAAMAHYKAGYAALITELPQYMVGLRGAKFAKNIPAFLKSKTARTGFDIITESGEEGYQFILGQEALRYGYDPDNYRVGDIPMGEYLNDPQMWTSAFFGGLGGAVFSVGLDGVKNSAKKIGKFFSNLVNSKDPQAETVKEIIKEASITQDQDDIISTFEALNEGAASLDSEQGKEFVDTSTELVAIKEGLEASRDSNNESENVPNRKKVNYLRGTRAYLGSKVKALKNTINNAFTEITSNSDVRDYNIAKSKRRQLKKKMVDAYNTDYSKTAIEELIKREEAKIKEIEQKEGFNKNDYSIDRSNYNWDAVSQMIEDQVEKEIDIEKSFLQETDFKNGVIKDEYLKDTEKEYSDKLNNTQTYQGFEDIISDINEELDNTFSNDAAEDAKAKEFFQNLKSKAVAQRDAKINEEMRALNMEEYDDFDTYVRDLMSLPFMRTLSKSAKTKAEAIQAEKWDKLNPDNKTPAAAKYKYKIGKVFKDQLGNTYMVSKINPEQNTYTVINLKTEEETILNKEEAEAAINTYEEIDTPVIDADTDQKVDQEIDTSASNDDTASGMEYNTAPSVNESEVEDLDFDSQNYSKWTSESIEQKRSQIQKALEEIRKLLKDLENKTKSASYNDFYVSVIDFISRHADLYQNNPMFREMFRNFLNNYDYKKSFKDFQKEVKRVLNIDVVLSDIQEYHDNVIANNQQEKLTYKKKRHVRNAKLEYNKEYTIEEIDRIINQFDIDPATKKLFEDLKGQIKEFGINVIFPSADTNVFGSEQVSLGGIYDHANKKIYINLPALFQSGDVSKAIVHEMIHGTLDYMFHLLETNTEALTEEQIDVLYDLELVRSELAKDPNFATEYAVSNVRELLAALSDERFVKKLRDKKISGKPNILKQIIDSILKLLGFPTSYYDLVEEGFDLLSKSTKVEDFNTSVESYNKAIEEEFESQDPSDGELIDENVLDEELQQPLTEDDLFDTPPQSEYNQLKEREAHLQRELDILDIVEKRNAERLQEIRDETIDGIIDDDVLDAINKKYDDLIKSDISKLEKIKVTTTPKQKKTKVPENLGIKKLTDEEITQVIEQSNPKNNEKYIGKYINTLTYQLGDKGIGQIEISYYEGGAIQRLKFNDNSSFARLVDLQGNPYGDFVFEMGEMEDGKNIVMEEFGVPFPSLVSMEELTNYINSFVNFQDEVLANVGEVVETTSPESVEEEIEQNNKPKEESKGEGKIIQSKEPTIETIGNVTYGTASKQGVGESNEDAVYVDTQGGIFIVADGMGGEGMVTLSAAQASNLVINRLLGRLGKNLNEILYDAYLENPNITDSEVLEILRKEGINLKGATTVIPNRILNAFKTRGNLLNKEGFRSGATAIKAVRTGKNTYTIEKVGDTVFFVVDKNGKVVQTHGMSTDSRTQGYMFSVQDGRPYASTPDVDRFTVTLNEGETLVLSSDFIETDKAVQEFIDSDFGKNLDFAKFQKNNKLDDSTFITIRHDSEAASSKGESANDKAQSKTQKLLNDITQLAIRLTKADQFDKSIVNDLIKTLTPYDKRKGLTQIKDILTKSVEAGSAKNLLLDILYSVNLGNSNLENINPQDIVDYIIEKVEEFDNDFGTISNQDVSPTIITEKGEKVITLDSWVKRIGNSELFVLARDYKTGKPFVNPIIAELAKDGYQVDGHFLRNMAMYGDYRDFKVTFKIPTKFKRNLNQENPDYNSLYVLMVVTDNSGKEHIVGLLNKVSDKLGIYPNSQTAQIRRELFDNYTKAKNNNSVPSDYIESNGSATLSQIIHGRVNSTNKKRRRLSEIWNKLPIKGLAVALPSRTVENKFDLKVSNLQFFEGDTDPFIPMAINSSTMSRTEDNLFILARDSGGAYRWIRVHEVNVGKHEQVKQKVDGILSKIEEHSNKIRKLGIRSYGEMMSRKSFPEVQEWLKNVDSYRQELQSLVRFKKIEVNGAKSYHPNINYRFIFNKDYLENGFFSKDVFLEKEKIYDRPSQVDYKRLKDDAYVQSVLDRMETSLLDGDSYIYPAIRFNNYTSDSSVGTPPAAEETSQTPPPKETNQPTSGQKVRRNKSKNKPEDKPKSSDDIGDLASPYRGKKFVLNEEQARKEMKELLGDFPLEIVDGLINVGSFQAYGLAKRGLIKLSKFANNKTLYHEAFHIVFRGMLSPETRANLLKEAKERYALTEQDLQEARMVYDNLRRKYKNLPESTVEEIALEEKMANEFQEYRIVDTGVKGLLRKLFRTLKNFIKKISGNWREIDTVFRKLDRGEYKEGIVANNFNDAFQPFELTEQQIEESVTTGLVEFEKVLSDKYKLSPDSLMQIYASALNEDPELDLITSTDVDSVLNFFLDHYGENPTYKDSILKIAKALRPDIKSIDINEDGDVEIDLDTEMGPVKGPLYVSFLEALASKGYSVKLDTLSLTEKDVENTTDEQDTVEKTQNENPKDVWSYNQSRISPKENMGYFIKRNLSFIKKVGQFGFHGMQLYYTHHDLYPELQRVIGGSSTITEMLSRLKKHSLFSQLTPFVQGWNDAGEKDLEILKRNARANKFVIQLFKLAQQKNSNTHVLIYPSTVNSSGKTPVYIKANRYSVDRFIKNNLKQFYKDGGQSILDFPMPKEAKQILSDVRQERKLDALEQYWDETKILLAQQDNADPNESLTVKKNREIQLNSNLTNLTNLLSDYFLQDFQDSTFSVEGEKLYEWGKPGFLSRLLNKAKSNAKSVAEYYSKDPLYANLPIFSYLSNLKISNNGGIKYQGEKVGTPYDKMTTADHFNIMLNSWYNDGRNNGHISLPIYSDSPVNEMLEVPKLSNEDTKKAIQALIDFETDRINQANPSANNSSNFKKNKNSRILIPPRMGSTPDEVVMWAEKTATELINKIKENPNIELHGEMAKLSDYQLNGLLTNFVLNHVAWQGQMILISAGDPAFYKSKGEGNVVDDFFKRVKELYSPLIYGSSEAFWVSSNGEVTRVPQTMNITILPDIEAPAPQLNQLGKILGDENLAAYKEGVSLTDGMTLLTPHSYKYRMIAMGEWTEAKNIVWNLLVKGKLPSKKNLDAVIEALPDDSPIKDEIRSIRSFESIKPYVYTMVLQKVLTDTNVSKLTPFQKKDSEVLMIPFYGLEKINGIENPLYNPFYKKLLEHSGYVFKSDGTVEAVNIDTEVDKGVFTFDSTLKAYKPDLNLPEGFNVETNIDDYLKGTVPIVNISYDAWGKQQENPSHYFESSELFGTQLQKLIIVDLKNNHPNYDKIVNTYQQLVIDNIKLSYSELESEISDWDSLIKRLREDALNRGLGKDFLRMLQQDENGELLVPLWHPVNSKTIESLLSSMYRKGVTNQKFSNGYSLINRSAVGFVRKPRIVFKDADGKIIEADDTTSVPKSIAYMEAILPVTNEEIAEYINEEGFIDKASFDKMPSRLKESIAYRIPNEYFYSDFKIKAIAFDPFSDTMTLPHEITAIAGLDFDIDKVKGISSPKEENFLNIAKKTKEGRKIVARYAQRINDLYSEITNVEELLPNLKFELAKLTEEVSNLSNKDLVNKMNELIQKEEYINLKKEINKNFETKNELYSALKDLIDERNNELLNNPQVNFHTNLILRKRNNEKALFKLMWNDILGDPSVASKQLKPGGFATVERLANYYKNLRKQGENLLLLSPLTTIDIAQRMNQGKALTGIAANALASNALWQHYNITHPRSFDNSFYKVSDAVSKNIKEGNIFTQTIFDIVQQYDANNNLGGKIITGLSNQDIKSNAGLFFNEVVSTYKSYFTSAEYEMSYPFLNQNTLDNLNRGGVNISTPEGNQNILNIIIQHFADNKKSANNISSKSQISFTPQEIDEIFSSIIPNVTFKDGALQEEFSSLESLSDEFDNTGVSKIQNMAEFLAAAVDNGKNPLAGYINVNPATSDYLFGLLSLGYSIPQAISILNNPEVLKLSQQALLQKSKLRKTLPLRDPSLDGPLLFDKEGNLLSSDKQVINFLANIKDLVDNISNLISVTKIGDAGMGASLSSSAHALRTYSSYKEDTILRGDTEMLYQLKDNPFYMGTLVDYGISKPLHRIIREIDFPDINGYAFSKLLKLYERYKNWHLTEAEIDSMYRQYMEYLGSDFYDYKDFSSTYKDNINKLKAIQKANPENKFLRKIEYTPAGYLVFQSSFGADKTEVQAIKNAAKKVPADVLKFLKNYSYYASGFRFSAGGFTQYLPLEAWVDKKEIKSLEEKLKYFNENDSEILNFFDQYVRNNYRDLSIVREPYFTPYLDKTQTVLLIEQSKYQLGSDNPYLKKWMPNYGEVLFKFNPSLGKWVSITPLSTYEDGVKRVQRYFFGQQAAEVYSRPLSSNLPKAEPPTSSREEGYFPTEEPPGFSDFDESTIEGLDVSPTVTTTPSPTSSNINTTGEGNPNLPKKDPAKQEKTFKEESSTTKRKDTSSVTYDDLIPEQKDAHDKVLDFFLGKTKGNDFLLQGKAGTGKTTVIKIITENLLKQFESVNIGNILVLAPTNQAANNLKKANLPTKKVKISTISSALGETFDAVTGRFERSPYLEASIETANFIIIDEASMISETTYNKIRESAPNAKILYAGDSGQLIPVRENTDYIELARILELPSEEINKLLALDNMIKNKSTNYKQRKTAKEQFDKLVNDLSLNSKLSIPFLKLMDNENGVKLLQRIRQGEDSSILPWADHAWNHSHKPESEAMLNRNPYNGLSRVDTNELVFPKKEENNRIYSYAVERFKLAIKENSPNLFKIIAYRNNTVAKANEYIRKKIFGENAKPFNKGELLRNIDTFSILVEGVEVYVTKNNSMQIVNTPTLETDKNLFKNIFDIVNMQTVIPTSHPFFVKWSNTEMQYHEALVNVLDEQVTIKIPTPETVKKLKEFKEELGELRKSFMNDRVKYKILSKTFARTMNLYTEVSYAYAITSHQSQGSTYVEGLVLEDDIYSVKKDHPLNLSKSFYTALTRFSDRVFVRSDLNGSVNGEMHALANKTPKQQAIDFYTKDLPNLNEGVRISKDGSSYEKGNKNSNDFVSVMRNTHFLRKPSIKKVENPVQLVEGSEIEQRMAKYAEGIISTSNNPLAKAFGGPKKTFGGAEKLMVSVNSKAELDQIKPLIDKAYLSGNYSNSVVFIHKTLDEIAKGSQHEKDLIVYLFNKGFSYYEHDGIGMYKALDKNNWLFDFSTTMGTKIDKFLRDYFNNEISEDLDSYEIVDVGNHGPLLGLIKQLDQLMEYFKSKGETPIALETTFIDTYNGIGTTLDLITIDEKGKEKVYDFKTMRGDKLKNGQYEQYYRSKHQGQLSIIRITGYNSHGRTLENTGFIIPIVLNEYKRGDTRVKSLTLTGENSSNLSKGEYLIRHKLLNVVTNDNGDTVTFDGSKRPSKPNENATQERGEIRQFRPMTNVKPEVKKPDTSNVIQDQQVSNAYIQAVDSLTLDEINSLADNKGMDEFTNLKAGKRWVYNYFGWILKSEDSAFQSLEYNLSDSARNNYLENLNVEYNNDIKSVVTEFNIFEKLLDNTNSNLTTAPVSSAPTSPAIETGDINLGTETAPTGGNVVIDAVKGKSPQPNAVVAFRTKGKTEQNMIDALADNAVGNPFGPYAAIKVKAVGEAVTRFLNWLEGKGDTNVMQNYRNALLAKVPELKGKIIYYYRDLGRPSHATALDYFLNGPVTQPTQQAQQPTTQPKMFDPNDRSIRPGSVVKYNGKTYLLWNINNSGKAQLIGIDGSKFSGTPNIDKLQVTGGYKTTTYNGTEYIVTDNNTIYSTATGKKVYEGLDDSSKKQKQNILNQVKSGPQPTPQKGKVKKGVTELFESNSKLASIGTPQQYTEWINYLTTQGKLAGTQATDILYHGSDQEFDTFDKTKRGTATGEGYFEDEEQTPIDSLNAFFFSTESAVSEQYGLLRRVRQIDYITSILGNGVITRSELTKLKEILPELYNHLKEKQKELNNEDLQEYIKQLYQKYDKVNNELGTGFLNRYNNYTRLGKQLQDLKNKKEDILSGKYVHNSFTKSSPDLGISFYNKSFGGIHIYNDGKIRSDDEFNKRNITSLSSTEFNKFISIGEQSYQKGINELNSLMSKSKITPILYRVLLNVQRPLVKDFEGKSFVDQAYEEGAQYEASKLTNQAAKSKGKYDSVIFKNILDPYMSDNYGVFEPEQVYMLGSTEDIEGFKKFVSTQPTTQLQSTAKDEVVYSTSVDGKQLMLLRDLQNPSSLKLIDENGNTPSELQINKFALQILRGNEGTKDMYLDFEYEGNNYTLLLDPYEGSVKYLHNSPERFGEPMSEADYMNLFLSEGHDDVISFNEKLCE